MSFDVGQYTTDEFWRETTRKFGRLLIVVWRLTLTITYYNSDPSYYFKFINCMKEVIHNKSKVAQSAYTRLAYCEILIEKMHQDIESDRISKGIGFHSQCNVVGKKLFPYRICCQSIDLSLAIVMQIILFGCVKVIHILLKVCFAYVIYLQCAIFIITR